MSGGGAGKVYFVLYLAVILELLIIIVERDEAEEHLVQKRKESMKIVESILAQLQTGSGTEGINTRPQDEITVVTEQSADGPKIRQDREYVIEVGVTDVRTMENKPNLDANDSLAMLKLSNVGELEYQVFFAPSKEDLPPVWPNEDSLKKMRKDISSMEIGERIAGYEDWEMKGIRRISLDVEKTRLGNWRNPYYGAFTLEKGNSYAPDGAKADSIFFYDSLGTSQTAERNGGKFDRRRFVVRFQPDKNSPDGWYKLRFFSRTNKILGVQGAEAREPKPDEVVNIGTVKLKVRDLHEVLKEQEKELKGVPPRDMAKDPATRVEFNERIAQLKEKARATGDQTMIDKYQLYSYIVKLITPGASDEFEQNKGNIEIDVRVVKPPMKEDVPLISNLPERVNVFDKLSKLELPFQVSPATGNTDIEGAANGASIRNGDGAVASASGGARLTEKVLSIPVRGTLTPRSEPYVFTVSQRAGAKSAQPAKCSVYVYPTKVDNESDIESYLELYWGAAVEFTAIVPTAFKSNEFLVTVDPGDNQQRNPMRKLTIKESDNLRVPPGASTSSARIEWEDPYTKERVLLLEKQGTASLKPPIILTKEAFAQKIVNKNDPVFEVEGLTILPPDIGEGEKAMISSSNIRVSIKEKNFDPNSPYKSCDLELAEQPKLSGNKISFKLRVKNPPPTMRPGTLRAFATIQVQATATARGTTSSPRLSSFNITITN